VAVVSQNATLPVAFSANDGADIFALKVNDKGDREQCASGRTQLVARAAMAIDGQEPRCVVGPSWTTDAPFRETPEAIEAARAKGILAVEMEVAALYTFARVTGASLLCLAHVTNTMGQPGGDFEKGEADGTRDTLVALGKIVADLSLVTAQSRDARDKDETLFCRLGKL
jgi:purine-nucleoside phosphorylase